MSRSFFFRVAVLTGCVLTAAPAAPAQHDRPDHVFVTGRCVAAEDGQPIAGCEIAVTGHQATGLPLGWGILDWMDPEPVRSGVDGRFRIRVHYPSGAAPRAGYPSRIHVHVDGARRVGGFGSISFPRLFEDGGLDCGDVRMPLGYRPAIRIEDDDGRPVGGVRVVARIANPVHSAQSVVRFPVSRSNWIGDDGLPIWTEPLQAGEWTLEVIGRESIEEITPVVVGADQARRLHRVRLASLEDGQKVRGHVVDAEGHGIPGILVRVGLPHEATGMGIGSTHADGAFEIALPSPIDGNRVISIRRNRSYDRWAVASATQPGVDDVRIELPRSARLTLAAVDARGAPVVGYSVLLDPGLNKIPLLDPVRGASRAKDGTCQIDDLFAGHYRVIVHPHDRRLQPTETEVELPMKASSLRVLIEDAKPRKLRLICAGRPVEGAVVELLSTPNRALLDRWVYSVAGRESEDTSGPNPRPVAKLVHRRRSDARGRTTLFAPALGEIEFVRVTSSSHLSTLVELDAVAAERAGQTIELTLAARARGTITPVATIDARDTTDPKALETMRRRGTYPNVWQKSVHDLWAEHRPGIGLEIDGKIWQNRIFAIDTDGRFDLGTVPPGRAVLRLVRQTKGVVAPTADAPLATIDFVAGEEHELSLQAPPN